MQRSPHSFTFLADLAAPWRYLAYALIILLLGNLAALTDSILHPGIPYFAGSHGIVGIVLALLATMVCIMLESHVRRQREATAVPRRLGPYPWIMVIVWTGLIAASFNWAIHHKKHENFTVAMNAARTIFEKDLVYYRWAASQHGVFVPVSEDIRPNPYLRNHPESTVVTRSGQELTLVNPEYMIRQVYEMQATGISARGHITSLDPVRAGNAADAWESKALNAFEDGEGELWTIEEMEGERYFRLMRPMRTEQECLKCHRDQGYEVGDIRGGISVSVPMTLLDQLYRKDIFVVSLAHGALWIIGVLGIFLGSYRVTYSMREKEQAETRLRSIINNMLDGLITLDAEGAIESLNTSATVMFGCAPEDATGKTIDFLIRFPSSAGTDSDGRRMISVLGETMTSSRPLSGIRQDGTSFPLALSLSEMLLADKQHFILMVRDITEEEQRRNEALRAGQLAAIGELAAGVAHEINNPVNGIINYTQILLDEAEDSEPATADILQRIIKEGERVAAIVSNLLAFARQRDEVVGNVKLKEVIDDCIALLLYQMEKDGIHLTVDIPAGLPCLRGNPQQLHQVFLNLLTNARYAVNHRYDGQSPDKRIAIESSVTIVDGRPFIKTTITDWGVGIPQDVIDRIFDSLFTTKPPGEGTGLGLSISKGLIRDHQGQLNIESVVGDYTTATVMLPVSQSHCDE